MRIIAGAFRSRKLKSVPGVAVRPTPDRLREALFNVLAPRIEGASFMDAYAGSGAVGLEAASRGAHRVYLVERSAPAVKVIHENVAALQLEPLVTVIHDRALRQIGKFPVDYLFLDPPYELTDEYRESLQTAAQMNCRLVIAQHDSRFEPGAEFGTLKKYRVLRQGDNSLSFYSRE